MQDSRNPYKSLVVTILFTSSILFSQSTTAIPKNPENIFKENINFILVTCAERTLQLKPNRSRVHALSGAIQLAMGHRTEAEAMFVKSIQLDSNDLRSHRIIAQAWLRHGDIKEALAAYSAMVDCRGGSFDKPKNSLQWAAIDLIQAGLTKEAENYMQRSYELDHSDYNNFIEFAHAALRSGQKDLAALYFTRAINTDPKDFDIWFEVTNANIDYYYESMKTIK